MPEKTKIITSQILEWFDGNDMKTAKGDPFEWYEHEFLIDPLLDIHPEQAYNKSTQVGFSETMIGKVIFLVEHLGLNILYTLPTTDEATSFASQKINSIIDANPFLIKKISGNLESKEFDYKGNKRFLYIKGTYNSQSKANKLQTAKGVSYTTDANFHDEASKSDEFTMEQMKSRFDNSKYKWRVLYDNPTTPKRGADKVYSKSDQMHWIIKCSRCGYRQYLDWFPLDKFEFVNGSNHCWVDIDEKLFRCGKCKEPIREEDRRSGIWVAKYPYIKDYRGYWINQMMYIHHKPHELVKKYLELIPSLFANTVMGKPYIGSDVKITRQALSDNIQSRAKQPERGLVAMGVDQGREKQYVLGDEHGIFEIGRCKSWDEIKAIRNRWDAFIVMDANPETGEPKNICEEHKGKAWRAVYKPESDQSELARFSPKNDRSLVLVRREEMFDEIADDINSRKFPINTHINQLHEYCDEWENLVRMIEEDSQGNERFCWDQSAGPADFAHASLYWRVAMMKLRTGNAYNIGTKPSTFGGIKPETSRGGMLTS